MVKIEYSPNNRAWCQSCHTKILSGQIRIAVKASSGGRAYGGRRGGGGGGFINQYHHANCYCNRKDFTKFYGFRDLAVEDQRRFMTEEQVRDRFGAAAVVDHAGNSSAPASSTVSVSNATAAAEGKSAGSSSVGRAESFATQLLGLFREMKQQLKQQKQQKISEAADGDGGKKQGIHECRSSDVPVTVVGLKFASITAAPGQNVLLVREPENKYDPNAVKVTNIAGQTVGHIKKDEAAALSPLLAKITKAATPDCTLVAECKVLTAGDGYSQRISFALKKKDVVVESLSVGPSTITSAAVASAASVSDTKPAAVKKVSDAKSPNNKLLKLTGSDAKRNVTPIPANPYVKKRKVADS